MNDQNSHQASTDPHEAQIMPSHRNFGNEVDSPTTFTQPNEQTNLDIDASTKDIRESDEIEPLLQQLKKTERRSANASSSKNYQTLHNNQDDQFIDRENGTNEIESQQNKRYRKFLEHWKWALKTIVVLNILVFIVVLVSDYFIAIIPTERNASFQVFTLITIALIGNCFNLWFNELCLISKTDYKITIVLTALPILNFLLLVMFQYTRKRIYSMTIFAHVWLLITFAFNLYETWVLRQYSDEFTAPEARDKHTIKEWIDIAFRNSTKIILAVLLFFTVLNTFLFVIDTHNTNDNEFVWTDDYEINSIHLKCYGIEFRDEKNTSRNQPIVLYEHGGEETSYTSAKWIEELYQEGSVQSYCVYDRFGYGLSDSVRAPVSVKTASEALRYALIEEKNITGPFVAVGFDYGGLVSRHFAAENKDRCSGLMLIDSWHEELLNKRYGNNGARDKKLEARVGKRNSWNTWFKGLWSTLGIDLYYSVFIRHEGSKERIFGKTLPHQGKFLRMKYLESIGNSLLSYKDMLETNSKLANIKLSVVSSKDMIRRASIWGDWQRKLTKLSRNTKEWKIIDGGHNFYNNVIATEQVKDVLLRLLDD